MSAPNRADEIRVSVVVPVFRSTTTLWDLCDRVSKATRVFSDAEIILVDDGSPPLTWSVVEEIASKDPNVLGIRLGRNYGQHSALLAGVRAARNPLIVTLDDDLQNPPEEIPRMVSFLIENDLDVVYGLPRRVNQPLWRRLGSDIANSNIRSQVGKKAVSGTSSFRCFKTSLREAFAANLGSSIAIDALLTWGSSRFGEIEVEHHARAEGVSNYSFRKLVRFAIDTLTGYSAVPLQVATVLGVVAAGFGLLTLIYVLVRLLVTGDSIPGFPFLASTIAIFSGTQLLILGVLGEYLARMHFRIMNKPTYLIAETCGGSTPAPSRESSAR